MANMRAMDKADYDGYGGIGGIMWLAFNLQKPPFNDLRVRQAIAYTIDRQFLVDMMYEGIAKVATGPISPDSPFYTNKVEKYDVDIKHRSMYEELRQRELKVAQLMEVEKKLKPIRNFEAIGTLAGNSFRIKLKIEEVIE